MYLNDKEVGKWMDVEFTRNAKHVSEEPWRNHTQSQKVAQIDSLSYKSTVKTNDVIIM